jgi:hypothetical protein
VQWDSPSAIQRHAQPVLFDWRLPALPALRDSLPHMLPLSKEGLMEDMESDEPLLYYNLELGDYLLRLFLHSACSPVLLPRITSLVPLLQHSRHPPARIPAYPLLLAPWLPVLIRPSDAALGRVTALWRTANTDPQVPVRVVLVQLRQGGHTHSYKLLNETGEAALFSCALAMSQFLDVPCDRLAYFIAADKQKGRSRTAARLSQQNCSRVLHFGGPIVRSGDDLNKETDEGGFSPVQVDDEGQPRTMEGKGVQVFYLQLILGLRFCTYDPESAGIRYRPGMGGLVGRRVRAPILKISTASLH